MIDLAKKLEEIKMSGNYAVTLYYGEDIGCDDSDIKQTERRVKIVCTPVGFLGSIRTIFVGTLDFLDKFDPKSKPEKISNPPSSIEYANSGFYVWGNDDSVAEFLEKRDNKTCNQ